MKVQGQGARDGVWDKGEGEGGLREGGVAEKGMQGGGRKGGVGRWQKLRVFLPFSLAGETCYARL